MLQTDHVTSRVKISGYIGRIDFDNGKDHPTKLVKKLFRGRTIVSKFYRKLLWGYCYGELHF